MSQQFMQEDKHLESTDTNVPCDGSNSASCYEPVQPATILRDDCVENIARKVQNHERHVGQGMIYSEIRDRFSGKKYCKNKFIEGVKDWRTLNALDLNCSAGDFKIISKNKYSEADVFKDRRLKLLVPGNDVPDAVTSSALSSSTAFDGSL